MKSETHGAGISGVEVSHISRHGVWLCVGDCEYFLPYLDFPWFCEAKVKDILDVQLLHEHHLHWPAIDVDLEIDSLENPSKYPLIFNPG